MIVPNDVFKDCHGNLYRLLSISPDTNVCWYINVQQKLALPISKPYSDLLDEEKNHQTTQVKSTTLRIIRASLAAQKRSQKAFDAIKPLLQVGIYDPATRNALLQARSLEIKYSKPTLLRYLRRFWQGGQTQDALILKFDSCGKSEREHITATRGRPSPCADNRTYQIVKHDHKVIFDFIKKYLITRKITTYALCHQRLLEKHYSQDNGDGTFSLRPLGEYPSYRQFCYILHREFPLDTLMRARFGHKEFEQNHRAKTGFDLGNCLGIGHRYEIDATIADIFLVSRRDRRKIIGKPTLYLVIDKYSRLIVGFYIGLEEPSWAAAMMAIVSIAENKQALCLRYGIEYDPTDWPAEGMYPAEFVADRGSDFTSHASSAVTEKLGIRMLNLPAKRPERKGTVECGFKLLQRPMADTVKGYAPPEKAKKRQGIKYEKDASLTLTEFTKIIIRSIIKQNRRNMMDYPLSGELQAQDISPSPRDIWAACIKSNAVSLKRFDEEYVRFSLLPEGLARITQQGIIFSGCYYSCTEAIEGGWFVRAGRKQFSMAISFDKRLVDDIYIHDPKNPSKFITATLTDRSREYVGMSFDEVKAQEIFKARLAPARKHENRELATEFHQEIDKISRSAYQEMKAQTKKTSLNARMANTREDRREELSYQRNVEARMKPKAQPQGNATVVHFALKRTSAPRETDMQRPAVSLQEKINQFGKDLLNG